LKSKAKNGAVIGFCSLAISYWFFPSVLAASTAAADFFFFFFLT
jgi:hypothetical protein